MVKQQNLKQDFPSVCKIHTISLCSLLFVLTITAEEVIQHLADYLGEPGCGTHVDIGKFMVYLQKEQKASAPEHLGVLVQSLGVCVMVFSVLKLSYYLASNPVPMVTGFKSW
jgi:hypothetical protein